MAFLCNFFNVAHANELMSCKLLFHYKFQNIAIIKRVSEEPSWTDSLWFYPTCSHSFRKPPPCDRVPTTDHSVVQKLDRASCNQITWTWTWTWTWTCTWKLLYLPSTGILIQSLSGCISYRHLPIQIAKERGLTSNYVWHSVRDLHRYTDRQCPVCTHSVM